MARRYCLSLRVDSGTSQSIINTSGSRRSYLKMLNWCFFLPTLLPLCPDLNGVKMVPKDLTLSGQKHMTSDGIVKIQYLTTGLMLRLESLMSIRNVMIN